MSKIVYSVQEVADLLGIGLSAAYTLTKSEGFPCIKIGKRRVVSIEAFHQWVEKQTARQEEYHHVQKTW